MTNESIPAPEFVEVEQPPITHKIQGIGPYSMIDGLLAFQPDQYYNDAFRDSVRISGLRDQFMAGAGAELEQEKVAPPPATAYTNPQGEFVNPDPPPGAPPVQQPPPAAPQRPQGGQQQQGGQGERQAPEWLSWPVMPDWLCDRDPSHEVRERPAAGNAGRRAICHVCKDELTGGRSAHHVVTGGWLDN